MQNKINEFIFMLRCILSYEKIDFFFITCKPIYNFKG